MALRSPFYIAQFCNHPPKGVLPNVCFMALDIVFRADDDLSTVDDGNGFACRAETVVVSAALRHLIANVSPSMAVSPTVNPWPDPVHTIALVTTRTVRNEELFVDYQYGGRQGHEGFGSGIQFCPRPWYHPVTTTEADTVTTDIVDDTAKQLVEGLIVVS